MQYYDNGKTVPLIFIGLFLLITLAIRAFLIPFDLPYYAIDENDVVEPALAFLKGDWDPRWYKYGPLFSYILAGIYKVYEVSASAISGLGSDDFIYNTFFNQTLFYCIARSFHLLIMVGILIISTLFARRFYNRSTAAFTAVLTAAPILDLITDFTVRVDTLQGFLSLACIYISVFFGKHKNKLVYYGIAGMVAGMNIAVKPLPGLLLIPTLMIAHYFSVETDGSYREKFSNTIFHSGLAAFFIFLIVTHSLIHPYSIINFKAFIIEQLGVFMAKSAQGGKLSGYDFRWLISIFGVPLSVASIGLIFSFRQWKDIPTRLLSCYVVTFFGVFCFFKTRMYWYNAVIPCLLILLARFIAVFADSLAARTIKINYKYIYVVLCLLFITHPVFRSLQKVVQAAPSAWSSVENRCDRKAQKWIENHIPENSRILTIGFYAVHLPRLYANTLKNQARWGEYFMYHRSKNLPWINAFASAYPLLKKTGKPLYHITNIRIYYSGDNLDPKIATFFQNGVDRFAIKNRCTYIVTASPDNYKGDWEDADTITKIKAFNRSGGCRGDEIKIFSVTALKNP